MDYNGNYDMTDRKYCNYEDIHAQPQSQYKKKYEPKYKLLSCCKIEKTNECMFEYEEYNRLYIRNQYKICGCKCCVDEVVKRYPLNGTKAQYINKFELNLKTCRGI